MNNPRLATRYAKSLLDLSKEMKQLEEVHRDMLFLQQVIKASREFVVMLNSPVIQADKKYRIISSITGDRISKITDTFIKLLCNKNREENLPGIVTAFLRQYNTFKGIHTATLTTALPVSDSILKEFESKIKSSSNIEHLVLESKVNDKLIGGFVLELEGKLVDASIARDLNDIKKQFDNNEYLHKLR